MKNERGVTLVALVITIIVMVIIIGITVSTGGDLLQKSKMTDYIGYMELVKARADDVLEEDMFNERLNPDGTSSLDVNVNNTITNKGYNDNNRFIIKVWYADKISNEGIDKSILGNNQCFVIVFDKTKGETVDVLYSAGCKIEARRYYALSDMKIAINGKIPVNNLLIDGGFENPSMNWNGITTSSIARNGKNSAVFEGLSTTREITFTFKNDLKNVYKNDNYYYASVWVYTENKTGYIQFYFPPVDETDSFGKSNIEAIGKWEKHSLIKKITANRTNPSIKLRLDYDNEYVENTVYMDDAALVNLTETFGEGKEPSKDWCDENLDFGNTY
ncbi:MAG: hypothetical protein ACI4UE_06875 [Candidatus Scatovivens sp.]